MNIEILNIECFINNAKTAIMLRQSEGIPVPHSLTVVVRPVGYLSPPGHRAAG